jgi:SAM-dependent methyltransferase
MKTLQNPKDTDWNNFWSREQSQRFSKLSWSKRRILAILKPRCLPGFFALDAGCGSGFFTKFFCDQGLSATALDYSESALKMAGQVTQGAAKLVRADMLNENLAEMMAERFDIIFTDGLFEHFSETEQDKIMRNLMSVSKPGGYIVTFVPNRGSPWELIRPFFMPGIEEKPFVLKGLLDLNRRNDLAVVKSGGVNVLPYAISPEFLGPRFGMLLFTVAKRVN